MSETMVLTGVLVDEDQNTLSFFEISRKYNLSETVLNEMAECGLFATESKVSNQVRIDQKTLQRIQSAHRLHQDLSINVPGVVLVMELLDELNQMRAELDILKRHLQR